MKVGHMLYIHNRASSQSHVFGHKSYHTYKILRVVNLV